MIGLFVLALLGCEEGDLPMGCSEPAVVTSAAEAEKYLPEYIRFAEWEFDQLCDYGRHRGNLAVVWELIDEVPAREAHESETIQAVIRDLTDLESELDAWESSGECPDPGDGV